MMERYNKKRFRYPKTEISKIGGAKQKLTSKIELG